MRILRNAWFTRFARKEGIADHRLKDAVARAERGEIDADLGGGLLKQRVARAGQGRSGGYRTIIIYRRQKLAFFVYGFSKSGRENLSRDELETFKNAARHVLSLSEQHLVELIAKGQFVEIGENDQEVPK